LLASIAAAAVLGCSGIVWGIASRSQMILLDGAYALVGIVLSALLLRASSLAGRGPTRRYPFGLEAATPLAIGVQGFVLLATLLYAMYEAVLSLRSGGSEVTAGWAIAYGIVVTVSSVAFTAWIARTAGSSDVLVSETAAWRIGAWRGVGMVLGFGVLALAVRQGWDGVAPYVDPVMVLVSCAALVGSPLRMIRDTAVELLEAAPPTQISEPVGRAVAELGAEYGIDEPEVHLTKLGPKLYLEVSATVDEHVTVREAHAARERLRGRLDALPYDVWLNVELRPRGANDG